MTGKGYTVVRADDVAGVYAGDEAVELWVVSRRQNGADAMKIDDFSEASPQAARTRN